MYILLFMSCFYNNPPFRLKLFIINSLFSLKRRCKNLQKVGFFSCEQGHSLQIFSFFSQRSKRIPPIHDRAHRLHDKITDRKSSPLSQLLMVDKEMAQQSHESRPMCAWSFAFVWNLSLKSIKHFGCGHVFLQHKPSFLFQPQVFVCLCYDSVLIFASVTLKTFFKHCFLWPTHD